MAYRPDTDLWKTGIALWAGHYLWTRLWTAELTTAIAHSRSLIPVYSQAQSNKHCISRFVSVFPPFGRS